MNTNEIMNELESVYTTLSTIPVTGDAVDAMAIARGRLRKLYAELKKSNTDDAKIEN